MKYRHIIYNSSEKNRSGAVGFGVRSATRGISEHLIESMDEQGLFAFTAVGKSLTPSALAADPDMIRGIVPTYYFRTVNETDGRKAFILGRQIAVGFDYTFYLNGKPGRLGNYVVDAYIFDECPRADEFEIFLENPGEGNNHFIPASPAPVADNQEMVSISLGHNPDLDMEERGFQAKRPAEINGKVIDLLFAFIKSRKEGKPLLVKADIETPPRLMASLARLLPENELENMTFLTNHADEGKKKGVNIVFVNEYYGFDIFPGQWVIFDLKRGDTINTTESQVFAPIVEQYAREGNFAGIHRMIGWCMSETYEESKGVSRNTQTDLYRYLYEPENFELSHIPADRDLYRILSAYIKRHPGSESALMLKLQREYDDIENMSGLKQWIDYILSIRDIDCSRLLDENRRAITVNVFEDPETFRDFYSYYKGDWEKVMPFLEREAFPDHSAYLTVMNDEWDNLYRIFLTPEEQIGKNLIMRMLDDKVSDKMIEKVIASRIPDRGTYMQMLGELLEEGQPEHEKRLLQLLHNKVESSDRDIPDFFSVMPGKINDDNYKELFLRNLYDQRLDSAEGIRKQLYHLDSYYKVRDMGIYRAMPIEDKIWLKLYEGYKKGLINGSLRKSDVIVDAIGIADSGYAGRQGENFRKLYDILNHTQPDEKNITELWNLAETLHEISYLQENVEKRVLAEENKNIRNLDRFVSYLINEGLISEEKVIELARRKERGEKFYIKSLLEHQNGKPAEQLSYLIEQIGYSDEDGMAYLEKFYPESYLKIFKSRQPSVVNKVVGFFKRMSNKTTDSAEGDRETNSRQNKK